MNHYGLSSRKRPPPVSDHPGLTFWLVAYGRFDCSENCTRQISGFVLLMFVLVLMFRSRQFSLVLMLVLVLMR